MKAFDPVVLAGEHVRLEPLGPAHIPGLVAAAAEDRTTYNWTPVPEGAAQIFEWVERLAWFLWINHAFPVFV